MPSQRVVATGDMGRPRYELPASPLARALTLMVAVAVAMPVLSGCGDDEVGTTTVRGLGGDGSPAPKAPAKKPAKDGAKADAAEAAPAPESAEPARPDRPQIILTREDFSEGARDPFQGFLPIDDEVPGETIATTKSRDVKMAGYGFEDLTLIGIVRSGRSVQPRALFVSNDGKSKTIRQGEYFSRAEVLLAAVNRDYVEIEVVDEEKAHGLNWPVGERRAIYLKDE